MWILGVFEGPDCIINNILRYVLQFSHGNRNILMCLFTFYPLLGTLLVPLGFQIELLPCVYCTFASEIVMSSGVYCIWGLLGIPLGTLGGHFGITLVVLGSPWAAF